MFLFIRFKYILGVARKNDWIRLNVDGLGVVVGVSFDGAICTVGELTATVANDALSIDLFRWIVA